jgi:hypothetical protein
MGVNLDSLRSLLGSLGSPRRRLASWRRSAARRRALVVNRGKVLGVSEDPCLARHLEK